MHDTISLTSSKNMIIRRDNRIRPVVQIGFIIFSVLLGIEFHYFVQSLENPDSPLRHHPAAVEAYLPISSFMSLIYYFKTGITNDVHPAGLVIFSLTLFLAFAVRRGFCSWICPIGTGAEYAFKIGHVIFCKNIILPKWIDAPLRSLKYLILCFFVYHIIFMTPEQMRQFIYGTYNRIADIKMYLFFNNISIMTIIVLSIITVCSILIKNFWCRYLCPYGALLGIISLFSPVAVRRDKKKCVSCGQCTQACPNQIAVGEKSVVRSTLCTACFNCVNACKVPNAIQFSATRNKFKLSPLYYSIITVLTFIFMAQVAKSSGYWYTSTPLELYRSLYSQISQIKHPR